MALKIPSKRKRPKDMIQTNTKGARILIADDEPGIRHLLHQVLCERYDCTEVCSAEEALARLRAEKFDLVLSDITMEGISGLEMLPLARECAPETVVVMISGEQTIDGAIQAMRAGAFDYVTKPFDLQHVEAAVGRALEHRALLETKRLYERHLEEKVNYLSLYDALTGLPNQNLFKSSCERELSAARNGGRKVATMFLSVDRSKRIYETLGHEVGDKLLREIGRRLSSCVREDDILAYFGGDEFALLLRQIGGAEDAVKLVGRVREALKPVFNLDGQELFITASLGISLSPDDGADGHTILKNAAAALDRARQQGGDQYQFYTADMNAAALQRLSLENDLRRALERGEFLIHYQPQVGAGTGRLTGMEALVRWQHPELGLVSPAEFIPLAEETGLIVPLGEWVLREACAQRQRWHNSGHASLRLAVNLSARQFEQPDLTEMIARVLAETGLDPRCLELELTESSVMKNADASAAVLGELKRSGIHISIDDFGTGYSSLSYLNRFPLDKLKVDQSFVRGMLSNQGDAAIVRAVITLAHSLKLKVVAEGVETKEQLAFLHLLKCDEMQGYLFSKPLPAAAFERLLMEEGLLSWAEALPA
jgi:diguanylate cyclase (GGDEF)-like protein